jgi:hypothetical protein
MNHEVYSLITSILGKFPYICNLLDDKYIRKQCENSVTNHLFKRLLNAETFSSALEHLPTLEKRLVKLSGISGYTRLGSTLKAATDWDQYQELLTQIDFTIWFDQIGLVKEIEPGIPNSPNVADILLFHEGQDIYCEVSSFASLPKLMESTHDTSTALPKGEKRINAMVHKLRYKTTHQLPSGYPCILAINLTKSPDKSVFHLRRAASILLPEHLQVALIAVVGWEGDDEDFNWSADPDHFFINRKSPYRHMAERLLLSLNRKFEVV